MTTTTTTPKPYTYPGFGTFVAQHLHYTQAIRLSSRLILSGQGGWTHAPLSESDLQSALANNTLIPTSVSEEIDQAFANVDFVLKKAGGKGWSQVYKIITLSTSIPEQHGDIVRNLKKWMPGEVPHATWTEIGVAHLGNEKMRFEIEVEAWDPEGAAA